MIVPDAVGVVLIATLAVLASEILLYLWVYRTAGFKSAKESVQRQTKRDALKTNALKTKSNREKKLERKDSSVKKDVVREMAGLRFKQGVIMATTILTLYKGLNVLYYGHPVAKLPFEPLSLLSKITLRGLTSPAPNDCALAFILVLCQTGVRTNMVQLLGWGPSRKMSLLGGVFPNAQEVANR